MEIDSAFDGGNIECLAADDPSDIRLAIRPDRYSPYFQWFFFRLSGARGRPVVCRLLNAGQAAYAQGWPGYRAVVSEDRETWVRADTRYADGVLEIRLTPQRDAVWVAFFAPYAADDHDRMIARALASPCAGLTVLGRTLDGRPLDMLTVGSAAPGRRVLWVVARQHAGETMASWWVEGFLDRLLSAADPVAQTILDDAVLHLVPNMNPDGSRRGHLRCNAAGTDLNREWAAPSMAKSPEVYLVKQQMVRTGVDFCLDVHGDETVAHNFLIGTQRVPRQTAAMTELNERFRAALVAASPDYHAANGGWTPGTAAANLTLCSSAIANQFQCLAMTLEMPFKDEINSAEPVAGWSPARSRALGAATLDAVAAVLPALRAE